MKTKHSKILYKAILIFELFIMVLCTVGVFSAFPNNNTSNIIKEKKHFKKLFLGDNINISILNEDYDLLITGFLTSYLDYNKLNKLNESDEIYILVRKRKTGQEWVNSFFGHQEILGLESNKVGTILSFKHYVKAENSLIRVILKFIGILFFLIPLILILYSWALLFMFFLAPQKHEHVLNHILVQYKVIKNKK